MKRLIAINKEDYKLIILRIWLRIQQTTKEKLTFILVNLYISQREFYLHNNLNGENFKFR